MKNNKKINLSDSFYYEEFGENCSIYCAGHVFIDGKTFSNKQLASFFLEKSVKKKIINILDELDGHFAIIYKDHEFYHLIVDRSRSIPLFFSIYEGNLFVSDKINRITNLIKFNENTFGITQFKTVGACLDDNTMVKEINQVKTGHYLSINLLNSKTKFNQFEYFSYRKNFTKNNSLSSSELILKLDNIWENCFKQLIDFANGRKIVVPLSGGLDSRIIVYFLKRLGYNNVLCFSYGKVNNWEANISKNVAYRAGYEWRFIKYSRGMWKEFINSKNSINLFNFGCNLSSLTLIQDNMAIEQLKSFLPSDSIFVPGLSGDFLAGSHITNDILQLKVFNNDNLINTYISKNNISNNNNNNLNKSFDCINRINLNCSKREFISEFENLDYSERQSKYIVNSCRIYEFYGFEWTLPFFYKESLNFWKEIDLEHKIGKKLFLKYLSDKFLFEELPEFNKINNSNIYSYRNNKLFLVAKKISKEFKNWKKIIFDYYSHPMQWYGIFDNYLSYLIFSIINYKRDTNLSLRYISFLLKKFIK
jgi:asparagine synthase (glutamine-hydrolysing)